jgi:transcriptional regulator NrdR family protein
MSESKSDNLNKIARSYECDGCGVSFESFERLRQHEVDCKDDGGAEPL